MTKPVCTQNSEAAVQLYVKFNPLALADSAEAVAFG